MKPTMITEIYDMPQRVGDKGTAAYYPLYYWVASVKLGETKIFHDATMSGHKLTRADAVADAKRIAEMFNWEFSEVI